MRRILAVSLFTAAACAGGPGPQPLTAAGEPAWGTAGPYRLFSQPAHGRWAVICQARRDTDGDGVLRTTARQGGGVDGDAMDLFVVRADGSEQAIDRYLAADPTGRWLAIVRDGAAVLIDTTTWAETVIEGELPSFSAARGWRSWTIDDAGARLLFWRAGAPVVRELATGEERRIQAGRGTPWHVGFAGDGAWVRVEALVDDTSDDGRLAGPDHGPIAPVCGPAIPHEPAPAEQWPDEPHVRFVRLSDNLIAAGPDLLGPVGEAAIARQIGDEVVIEDVPGGPRTSLGACVEPTLLEAYAPARAVLLQCGRAARSIEWRAPGAAQVVAAEADEWTSVRIGAHAALLPFSGHLVDLTDGSAIAFGDRELVVATEDVTITRAPDDDTATATDPGGRTLTLRGARGDVARTAGRFVQWGPNLLHLDWWQVLELPVTPVGVRDDGAVLVDAGPQPGLVDPPDAIDRHPRMGPLRWMKPR